MEKILVVDDEIYVVEMLKRYLESRSYDVYTATDGAEALRKVKEAEPRVVLLDILMPGMSGIEVLTEIKKMNPQTIVIMVTAVIDDELVQKAIASGADDYITKPINLEYIETVVMVKLIQLLS
jgi:CheY-like chemotaxis protein